MSEPKTPIEAYKAIIDELAKETYTSISRSLVLEQGIFSKAQGTDKYNKFVQSLDKSQRELLAEMLQKERDGAIHDVLACLTWWITSRGVGLTFHGQAMPVDLSDMGLHGDYVGRREDWEWPEEDN